MILAVYTNAERSYTVAEGINSLGERFREVGHGPRAFDILLSKLHGAADTIRPGARGQRVNRDLKQYLGEEPFLELPEVTG